MEKKDPHELFNSEIEYCQAIIRMSQGVILLLDAEGQILDCNVFMEKLTGYRAGYFIGKNWRDILNPLEDGGDSPFFFQSIITGKPPRTKIYRLLTRNGNKCYLEFNFRVIKNDEGVFAGVLVVGYHVTERVKHQKNLEKERQALIKRNRELTCLYKIARLSGDENASLDEILKLIIDVIPPAVEYPEIAGARITLDLKEYLTDGYTSSMMNISVPIFIQGVDRGALEIVYDVSGMDQFETRLRFSEEEQHLAGALAHQLALIIEKREADQRKFELERQLRHADRLATIGQLAAGVAHELNEPLGNILGFAQLASRNKGLEEGLSRDLGKIIKSSLHAREIIKKLMLFGRQMPPQQVRVSLNKVVDDGLFFLEARCRKSAIQVERDLDPDLTELDADPSQLEQVLVNLVINAVQAMPDGGDLSIRTFSGENDVCLTVEDTGEGMEKEVLRQIFVPFFTTKDVDEGTGLGLSVVHGIITAHSGSIDVYSKKGHGTCFKIRLPLNLDAGVEP